MNSRAMMWVLLVAVRVYDPERKGLLNSRNWVTKQNLPVDREDLEKVTVPQDIF